MKSFEEVLNKEGEGYMLHPRYKEENRKYEQLIKRKNSVDPRFYNGVYERYTYPVLTAKHAPLIWRYDLNEETNPFFMERLPVNCVFNSGAIYLKGKYYLVARVERGRPQVVLCSGGIGERSGRFPFLG